MNQMPLPNISCNFLHLDDSVLVVCELQSTWYSVGRKRKCKETNEWREGGSAAVVHHKGRKKKKKKT